MTNLLLVTILVYGLPQITGHGLGQNRRNEAEGKVGKCRELRCFFKAVTSIFYENAVGRHLVIETDDNKISKTRFHSVQNFHTGRCFLNCFVISIFSDAPDTLPVAVAL